MELKYINESKICQIEDKAGVTFITFPGLNEYKNMLVHGFSTRLGGVSKAHLSSMNLSFSRGDERENVLENHRRFAKALGYKEKDLVFSNQVHKTNFHIVTKEDKGKGIIKESDILEIDGLVTDEKDIPIITFFADCVPIFLFDPQKEVIALVHSGWRGTVEKISAKMIALMENQYGCQPVDIRCAIAPSICYNCYEVSEDVAGQFIDKFGDGKDLLYKKENGKYQLNLHRACEMTLLDAGISKEHIDITDLCTCCNPDFFFSHRASHGMRGNLAAVMMLKSENE